MADELAKIGLDTADITRSLDRISGMLDNKLAKSAKNADKEVNALNRSMNRLGNAARAALGLAGLGGVAAAARSIKELNSDLEETRSHLKSGSKDAYIFDETVKSAGVNSLDNAKKASNLIDATMAHMKLSLGNMIVSMAKMVGIDVGVDKSNAPGFGDIQASRDSLSDLKAGSSNTEIEKLGILEQEIMLQEDLVRYYTDGAAADEVKRKAAAERVQQLRAEADLMSDAYVASEKRANIDRIATEFAMAGIHQIMSNDKIIAQYEEKITKARREGRIELEAQLTVQKEQALQANKAALNRMTPREKADARRAARKEVSDAKKWDARQEEFKRADKAGRKGDKGNPLGQWQARKMAVEGKKDVVMVGGDAIKYLETMAKNSEGNLVVKKE